MQIRRFTRRQQVAGLVGLATLFLTIVPGAAFGAAPDLDVRGDRGDALPAPPATNPPTAAQQAELRALRAHNPDLTVRWSGRGTPSRLRSLSGPLTDPRPGDLKGAATAFFRAHQALFRLSDVDVGAVRFSRAYESRSSGVGHFTLVQHALGLDVFGAAIAINVSPRGEILNVAGEMVADARGAVRDTAPGISGDDAALAAAVAAGVVWPKTVGRPALVYFPLDASLVLAWDVTVDDHPRSPDMYRSIVEAATGRILWRKNLTNYADPLAHGEVYTGASPLPDFPQGTAPGSPVARVDAKFNGLEFFSNSDPHSDWWAGNARTTTTSNNVNAYEDRDGNNTGGFQPTAGTGENFTFPIDLTQDPSTYQSAAIVNLFYWTNRYHDILYRFGFDEAAGNFQSDNFGLGGSGGDPVLAEAQDNRDGNPASLCNANFNTPGDGSSGRMQMYQCNKTSPERDGDLDNHVILHELTHGLSNRLVSSLADSQGGGMGEGWSDFVGLALLVDPSADLFRNYVVGEWLFGFGIRRQPYSTDQTVFTRTFTHIVDSAGCTLGTCSNNGSNTCTKDADCGAGNTCVFISCQAQNDCQPPQTTVGQGDCTSEVHAVGEIWANTLWIARANLVWKYGWATGNDTILQLVVDGMKLAPASPDFLDARDAILQADQNLTSGANTCLLWDAFARMGLGTMASSTGPKDIKPIQSFTRPSTCSPRAAVTAQLDLGNVCNGASASGQLQITNTGSGELFVKSVAVQSGSADVTVVVPPSMPRWVTAGDSLAVGVQCTPTGYGSRSATVRVTTNDTTTPTIDVPVACSSAPPDIRVTANLALGSVCAGMAPDQNVQVCNVGACPLSVTSAAFVPACTDFTLASNPFPATLQGGSCATAIVRFTPTSAGAKSCNLRVSSNDPDSPAVNVAASGTTPSASMTVAGDQGFPPTVIQSTGACSASRPFPVTNSGACPTIVQSVAISSNVAEYALKGVPSTPAAIAPGHLVGEGNLAAIFAPTVLARTRTGSLSVVYEQDPITHATTTVTRALCGEGVRTGARVLVTAAGVPLSLVDQIQLQRLGPNRNKTIVDTIAVDKNLTVQTVAASPPCDGFQYHREYGTVSNAIQLAPGSYVVNVSATVAGRKLKQTVSFDVGTCTFNPTVVVAF